MIEFYNPESACQSTPYFVVNHLIKYANLICVIKYIYHDRYVSQNYEKYSNAKKRRWASELKYLVVTPNKYHCYVPVTFRAGPEILG